MNTPAPMITFLTSLLPFAVLAIFWAGVVGRLSRRQADESRVEQLAPQAEGLEIRDVRSSSGLRTYQVQVTPNPEGGERSIRSVLFPLLVLVGLVVLAGSTISGSRQLVDMLAALGAMGAFYGVAFWWTTRRDAYRECTEIHLSDDGICELETKRRVIRLHASQIRSVTYRFNNFSEGGGESYLIRWQDGKLFVSERMTAFHDFLTRLKALNPGVDLSSFPADACPGLATQADARAAAVRRGLRGALFPASVVILLIWLAVETLR